MALSIPSRAFRDRKRNPDGKREAVLTASLEMFLKRGYRQTSLDDVAGRLKITKPAVYHYFQSKEAIYLECYRRGAATVQDGLSEIRAGQGNGLQKVARFIRMYTSLVARDFGRFLIRQDDRELSRPAQHKVYAEKRKIDEALRGFIHAGIEDGSIRPCNAKLAAFAIAGAVNAMPLWFEPSGDLTAEEIADEFAATLTMGLAKERCRP